MNHRVALGLITLLLLGGGAFFQLGTKYTYVVGVVEGNYAVEGKVVPLSGTVTPIKVLNKTYFAVTGRAWVEGQVVGHFNYVNGTYIDMAIVEGHYVVKLLNGGGLMVLSGKSERLDVNGTWYLVDGRAVVVRGVVYR